MMLDWIAMNADPIFAAMNFFFIVSLVPTVWHQWRLKASTVPMQTSVLTTAALMIIVLVFISLRLWLTVATDIVTTALWATIAAQRYVYGAPEED